MINEQSNISQVPIVEQKSNKKAMWIIIIVLVLALIVIGIIFALRLIPRVIDNNTDENYTAEVQREGTKEEVVESTSGFFDVQELRTAQIGEEVDFSYYTLTILQVLEDENMITPPPMDGFKYISIEVAVKNIIEQPIPHIAEWTLYDENEDAYQTFARKEPTLPRTSTVSVNETIEGWINFRVPVSSQDFTLKYEASGYDKDWDWKTYTVEVKI
jgi:hypothetical protein